MKKTRQCFSGLLAAMLILSLAAFGQTTYAASAEGGVVSTAAGQIRGTRTEYGGYRFLGVPYAQAKERFVPAEPVASWEGVRDADSYGDISPPGGLVRRDRERGAARHQQQLPEPEHLDPGC